MTVHVTLIWVSKKYFKTFQKFSKAWSIEDVFFMCTSAHCFKALVILNLKRSAQHLWFNFCHILLILFWVWGYSLLSKPWFLAVILISLQEYKTLLCEKYPGRLKNGRVQSTSLLKRSRTNQSNSVNWFERKMASPSTYSACSVIHFLHVVTTAGN